jgi:hypothetical protein
VGLAVVEILAAAQEALTRSSFNNQQGQKTTIKVEM